MSVISGPRIVTNNLVGIIDAADKSSYSPNVHPNPTDLFSWVTGGNTMTLSRATGVNSPVGNRPLRIVTTGTSGYTGSYNSTVWNLAPAASGQTWTSSVWVKASSPVQGSFLIFGSNSSGTYLEYGQTYFNIGTSWTRVNTSYTLSNAGSTSVQVRFDCYINGVTLYLDGWQVERSSAVTDFNPNRNLQNNTTTDVVNKRALTNFGNLAFDGNSWILPPDQTSTYMINSSYPWPTGDFTAEHWMRSTFNQANQTPYTYSVAGDNHFLMFTSGSTTMQPHTFGTASTVTVPDMNNTWNCFTRTRIRSSGVENYYYNGAFVGTATLSADVAATTNGFLIIGQESDSPGGTFDSNQNLDGRFGRLAVYNRVLSAAEIQQNYNAIKTRYGLT